MIHAKITIVEDDPDILELMAYNLVREGYRVTRLASGEKLLDSVKTVVPDLILLDIMLPGMDGLDLCRRLKSDARTRNIPIVMVTARSEEADIVAGLELGADDYIAKPFRPRELVARVRAVLRRRKLREEPDATAPVTIHGIVIDPLRREVKVHGRSVPLTFTEFEILQLFARHPGIVFTRNRIVDAVRGKDYAVTDRAVDVQIVGLRRKLGRSGALIETVRGVGYRMQEEER